MQLKDITTNFIDFTKSDVSLTLTIMESLLQTFVANLSHVAISNIVGTVSNVLGVPMKELVSAEQDNLSATR